MNIQLLCRVECDCTDVILSTLKEEGRDPSDVTDAEIKEMVASEFEDYDFNKAARETMTVTVVRENPADTARRVLQTVFDNTESFEGGKIGSELAYVTMAILHTTPDNPMVSTWDLSGDPGENHQEVYALFQECFDEWDVVWNYIEIIGT